MNQGVILFHTTSSALRAEKILKTAGMDFKLIPTPRELSSDCGIALIFAWSQREQIEAMLANAGVEYGIHRKTG